jgi:hypothetical protein
MKKILLSLIIGIFGIVAVPATSVSARDDGAGGGVYGESYTGYTTVPSPRGSDWIRIIHWRDGLQIGLYDCEAPQYDLPDRWLCYDVDRNEAYFVRYGSGSFRVTFVASGETAFWTPFGREILEGSMADYLPQPRLAPSQTQYTGPDGQPCSHDGCC